MVNFALWLPNLVKRIANASLNDDDLYGGQRSNGVKFSKLCSMATNVVRRSLMTITTCIKVKGQSLTEVKCDNLCYMATTFDQMYRYKLRMIMTFMKVIQRSSKVR